MIIMYNRTISLVTYEFIEIVWKFWRCLLDLIDIVSVHLLMGSDWLGTQLLGSKPKKSLSELNPAIYKWHNFQM